MQFDSLQHPKLKHYTLGTLMLWNRKDLTTLRSFACDPGYTHRPLLNGNDVVVERWSIRFPPAQPSHLSAGTLKKTYTLKPLVAPFGRPLFGEIAVLQCVQRDGWSGVWVDTYHGSELFWCDMPHESSAADLSTEPEILNLYRGIVAVHGKRGGFFDILAWRQTEQLFIEYKGKGDRPNANESSWIGAAIHYGVRPSQLLIVEYAPAAA